MSITYRHIQVEGIPFTRIKELYLTHQPNEHGQITVIGEIKPQDAENCRQRIDHTSLIKVTAVTDQETIPIFQGGIINLSSEHQADYSLLTVQGVSTSYLQDIQQQSRTYQNSGKTYGQILNQAYNSSGSVKLTIPDRPIGDLVLQLNETNWDFTKRMASRFNAPVIASITAPEPLVFVGLPPVATSKTVTAAAFSHGQENGEYNRVTQNYLADGNKPLRQDFSAQTVRSYDYAYLGDAIHINGQQQRIKGIQGQLTDGILVMQYQLAGDTGFVAPKTANTACAGRVLMGQVKEVQRDTVKVHFIEVDNTYDSSGDKWYPYSTAYSSSDGSGWYCMPEVGDYVRILFPSDNEADAFAASSVNASPPPKTRDKRLKAPSGKEVLLTDDGLHIICQHQDIFIDLTAADGIKIVSSKNIAVESSTSVTVHAAKDLQVLAEKQILIQTGTSYINLVPDQITLAGTNVLIT